MNGNFAQNKGILVTGGLFKAGNVAAGDGAQAVWSQQPAAPREPATLAELRLQLEQLMDVVQARRTEIPAPEEVLESVRGAAEEVGREKPRRGVVLALLRGISTSVANVLDVAGMVSPLIQAAGKLIH